MLSRRASAVAGALVAIGARALALRVMKLKFAADVKRLNAGDYRPLLRSYADDATLHFNEGPHRWSGDHRGKAAIERFLKDFTGAGLQGELKGLWAGGPPWALTILARFDDRALGPEGEELYANRVAMVIRTRWGRVVEHEDFYEDSARIVVLEEHLQRLEIVPAAH